MGKVQVFANPECTAYADGQSSTVYVRLNQDFGYGQAQNWQGSIGQQLTIMTPTNQDPEDPYNIWLWRDFGTWDQDEPFTNGQILRCDYWYDDDHPFTPINNPKVIFE